MYGELSVRASEPIKTADWERELGPPCADPDTTALGAKALHCERSFTCVGEWGAGWGRRASARPYGECESCCVRLRYWGGVPRVGGC